MVYQDQGDRNRAWEAANDTRGGQPVRPPGDARQINTRALNVIMKFQPVSLEACKVINGHAIGFGHRSRKIKDGHRITREDAHLLLYEDLEKIERKVEKWVKADLSDNQYGALVSLAFDIGLRQFRKSELRKHLNRGDFLAAAREFDSWIKVDGELKRDKAWRRLTEQDLFLCPDEETLAGRGIGQVTEQVVVKDLEVDAIPMQYRKRRENLMRESRTVHGAGVAGVTSLVGLLGSLDQVIEFDDLQWMFLDVGKGKGERGLPFILKTLDYFQDKGFAVAGWLGELARNLSGSGVREDIAGVIIVICFLLVMRARVADHKKERR